MTVARPCIVFDLDGTLVDSLADISAHLADTFASRGAPRYSPAVVRQWIGHGARDLIVSAAEAARRDGIAIDVDDALLEFRARYAAAPTQFTTEYPGIADALTQLAAAHELAVLSNKPHDLTIDVVAQKLQQLRFAAVVGGTSERPLKPAAAALDHVFSLVGCTSTQAVMVGDSEVDIECARAAGCRSIAVSWGLVDRPRLVAAKPDALVDTAAELVRAIRALCL